MALWDSISKKASETTAKAIQQAKILSETAKLNGLISNEEAKINSNYLQIGKLYYAAHQQDPEEGFAPMVFAIAEAEKKIQEYRQQIQQIRGVIRCEKCGAEIAKGVVFCSACGMAIPKDESAAIEVYETCASCGALVEKGMRFCTECGKPMIQTTGTDPLEVEESEPACRTRVCANCGTQIEDEMLFCTECGTKYEEPEG